MKQLYYGKYLVYCYCVGSISAEHGVGQVKKSALLQAKSRTEIELMKTLKRSVDLKNIMNPGKVFDL